MHVRLTPCGPCGGPTPKETGGREEEAEGKGTETERQER